MKLIEIDLNFPSHQYKGRCNGKDYWLRCFWIAQMDHCHIGATTKLCKVSPVGWGLGLIRL